MVTDQERNREIREIQEAIRGLVVRFDDLSGQVDYLGREQVTIGDTITALRKGGVRESAVRPSDLQSWLCGKCGSRIGLYDPATEELAMKYKDLVTRFRCGPGGFVETTCRACAFPARLDYEPSKVEPVSGA